MKLSLATSAIDDIRWARARGLADGLLLSPALLDAEEAGADVRSRANDLARHLRLPIVASTGVREPDDLYRDARELARLSDVIVPEFPFTPDAVEVMHRSVEDGIRVAASMIFTPSQALLAAKAGASFVLVPVTVLEAQGMSIAAVLIDMRAVFDVHRVECEIMAVLPRSAAQFGACAKAGVDAVALDPTTLRNLLVHPLADRTMDALLPDLGHRLRPAFVP
jgi:transaldolase